MLKVSRRDFLKLGGLALSGLALTDTPLDLYKPAEAKGLVRVANINGIQIYDQPQYPRYNDQVKVVGTRKRDQLLYVYEKFQSETGPDFNPMWYRLDEGYAHTAYLQPVDTRLNEILPVENEEGELFEVTVPLTQSYRLTRTYGWEKLYRLYYGSIHWVTGVIEGPDGATWYRILDDLLKIEYCVLANHLRKIPASELTPISTRVAPEQKRVEVSIAEQRLWAYEEGAVVLDTKISTGIPTLQSTNGIPTYTPKGNFHVFSKMPVRHMGDGQMTSDIAAYELPGVPWVSYFHEWGVAFHGTWWHDNFGNDMSRGCVNMRTDEAKWLFRWLLPEASPPKMANPGHGTRIVVF
ncbi:MAG: L,D-transpeptidase [Anaerolineales bacterium]|nr:L,D-transpeptidase [Anaerolineales bacterium]MCW5856086.1 L,D-transpeptidase [Anaerolineales bacterium]